MASKNLGPAPPSRTTTWRAPTEGSSSSIRPPEPNPSSSSAGGQFRGHVHVNPTNPKQHHHPTQHQHRYSIQANDPSQVMPAPPGSSGQTHHGKNTQQQQSFGGQGHGGGGGGSSGGGGGGGPCPSGGGGELFLENLDSCSRNPLFCLICNNVFDDPRLLSCYHSFCAKCLDGRVGDVKLACPICGKVTSLKEESGPPADHLLRFLLRNSSDVQPPCANCDNKHRVPMYYCNTCGQVLCNGCREETHRAKMFSAHDIIPVTKFSKETPKKCSIHGEQYIMFSTVQKSMLCINCYRDTAMDARLHCVDLETAYSQGCRKLDRAMCSLRDLQVAVRDGITMLKNVLEELRRNSDSEKSAVNAVCQTILDALTKTQENLLRDVDGQLDVKDKVIRGQLSQLRSVLPTIKLHLTMCATISNAASKYDFLDLAYPLIDRLTAITHMGYPIRPGQSSQIKSSYKSEIVRTLEPWISGTHPQVSGAVAAAAAAASGNVPFLPSTAQIPKDYAHPSINLTSTSGDPSFLEPTYSQYYPMSRSTMTPTTGHKGPGIPGGGGAGYAAPTGIGSGGGGGGSSGRKTPTSKGKAGTDGMDEQFTAHCRSFSSHVTELSQRLSRLKEQVQDLHRDVTLQRGTSYTARAEAALREGLYLEEQLNRRQAEMERIKKLFESTWNEHMRQVRIEQEVFQTQMNDLMSLRAEVKQLSSILQQLQSFLKSIGQQPAPGPGGGGSGGGGSGGGGGASRQPQFHPHQQTMFQDNKNYHLSSVGSDPLSRAESGSQVTPSLGEMAFSSKGGPSSTAGGVGIGPKKKEQPGHKGPGGSGASSESQSHPLTSRLGRFSISKVTNPSPFPGGQSSKIGGGHDMDSYIQVDPSYPTQHVHHGHGHGHALPPAPPPPSSAAGGLHSKRGMLSQLIDKVRSTKDDRKKSSSSTVSSSGHSHSGLGQGYPSIHPLRQVTPGIGSVAPTTSAAAAAAAAASRVRAAMYDAQVQYGTLAHFPADKSAVTALRRSGSHRSRVEDPPIYTRAKSFVKSKSDDERPPVKLSRESRARSVAAFETESLLRSLSSSSKEASRILSLYKSLLSDKELQGYGGGQYRSSSSSKGEGGKSNIPASRSESGRGMYPTRGSVSGSGRSQPPPPPRGPSDHSCGGPGDRSYLSEDDYQQIPMLRMGMDHQQQQQQRQHTEFRKGSLPASAQIHGQSHSHGGQGQGAGYHPGSLGRETGRSGHTQVKVFVHEEPTMQSQSSRSSPAGFSRSLEDQYMYSFLQGNSNRRAIGGLKKPVSCESLISLSSTTETENSRKSSVDFDRRSVVTVRQRSVSGSKNGLLPRQHSWEVPTASAMALDASGHGHGHGFKVQSSSSTPALSPDMSAYGGGEEEFATARSSSSSGRRPAFEGRDDGSPLGRIHKADSFEGHEEAVRSIVAAVQETRTMQRKMQSN